MTKDKMTDEEFKNTATKLLQEQKLADDAKNPPVKKTEEEQAIDIAVATCTGDIRDFLLDRVKALGKPWVAMTEDEQSDQIHAAKKAADELVRKVAEVVASKGKKAIIGKLVKIGVKDKIQAQIDFSAGKEGEGHSLLDAVGFTVSVVLADAEQFKGERGPAEPTPNQGSLLDKAEKLKKAHDKVPL